MYPQKTPVATNQVNNRERRDREDDINNKNLKKATNAEITKKNPTSYML